MPGLSESQVVEEKALKSCYYSKYWLCTANKISHTTLLFFFYSLLYLSQRVCSVRKTEKNNVIQASFKAQTRLLGITAAVNVLIIEIIRSKMNAKNSLMGKNAFKNGCV